MPAESSTDFGRTSAFHHKIDVGKIRQRPYVNAKQSSTTETEKLEADSIQPSNSPWSSQVILVRKRTGQLDLCRQPSLKINHA